MILVNEICCDMDFYVSLFFPCLTVFCQNKINGLLPLALVVHVPAPSAFIGKMCCSICDEYCHYSHVVQP